MESIDKFNDKKDGACVPFERPSRILYEGRVSKLKLRGDVMPGEQRKNTIQLTHITEVSTKARLTLKLRNVAARGLLVLLFGLGFFLSMIPSGRASMRAALLLPSLITVSE
jgi:hypothetical protein